MTREEISVSLGLDLKSLDAGLGISESKLKSWTRKRKTDEEEYTQFWKRELDKRTEADVEAATRSNRARRLLRERAARRQSQSVNADGPITDAGTLSHMGEQAGHFFGHGMAKSMRRAFHALTIGGMLKEIISVGQEYAEVKDDVEKLEEAFGHLNDKQKEALQSMADGAKEASRGLKYGVAAALGFVQDRFDVITEQVVRKESIWKKAINTFLLLQTFGVYGGKEAKAAVAEDREANAARERQEAADKQGGIFEDWYKYHIEKKKLEGEDQEALLEEEYAHLKHQARMIDAGKEQLELLKKAAEVELEIFELQKKRAEDAKKAAKEDLEHFKKACEEKEREVKKLDKEFQHHQQEMEEATNKDLSFSIGDLAKSDKGHFGRGRATSGWGAGRRWVQNPFASRANEIEEMRANALSMAMHGNNLGAQNLSDRAQSMQDALKKQLPWLQNPMDKLRDEAQRSADALTYFKEHGIQINADD